LSFKIGEIIDMYEDIGYGWGIGTIKGHRGVIPMNYFKCELTCGICDDLLPLKEFHKLNGCTHKEIYCNNCHLDNIKTKLIDNILDIHCMFENCPIQYQFEDIRTFADATTWEAYDEKKRNAILVNELGGFSCVNSECDSILLASDEENIVVCPYCKTKQCSICKTKWHSNQTCLEFQTKLMHNKEYAENENFIRNNAKRCPKCKIAGIKEAGCDHMTCKFCKHEYCWICFEPYFRDNVRGLHCKHNENCTHN